MSSQIMPLEPDARPQRGEDIAAIEADARLREDIRLLGRILGDTVRDQEGAFDLDHQPEGAGSKSIGRLRGFQGNYGCFVRSYAYICSLGAEGLREASEIAVLNANYLLALLRRPEVAFDLPAGGRRMLQRADGYVATIVSGQVALREGTPTAARPGRVVRSTRGAVRP